MWLQTPPISSWFIWELQVAEVQAWGTEIRKQRKPFQGCVIKLAAAIDHFRSILLRNLTIQAADPPLGYPIYSSKPLHIHLV